MKFDLHLLSKAVQKLHREVFGWDSSSPKENFNVEMSLSEEDISKEKFVDHIVLTVHKEVQATSYTPAHTLTYKLEVFSSDSRQKPRLHKSQTEEITDVT
jgi:hypothetical protein